VITKSAAVTESEIFQRAMNVTQFEVGDDVFSGRRKLE
jgi:hypothetical protein